MILSVSTIIYKGRRIRLKKRMFEILDYLTMYRKPGQWHNIGTSKADKSAIDRLRAEGLVEVRDFSNQYRLTP